MHGRSALRALELRPTLEARYVAARAAWRLQDWGAVQVEMAKVRDHAAQEGDRVYEALALTALGEASLKREGDAVRARELVDEALDILPADSDAIAHFDALMARAMIGVWLGASEDYVRYMERAYVKALDAGRKDLQTIAAQALASQAHRSCSSSTRRSSCSRGLWSSRGRAEASVHGSARRSRTPGSSRSRASSTRRRR